MSLLADIQDALMQEAPLGGVLLKLRFLASRLGSDLLEEWVRHETDGYPPEVDLPEYRQLPVAYLGTFSGPFGSGIKNAPIPSLAVAKHAGEDWLHMDYRGGIASIEGLLASTEGPTLHYSAPNLIYFLQGKIYPELACNSIDALVSKAAVAGITNTVRTRVLELTLQLEKAVPEAREVSVGNAPRNGGAQQADAVTHIAQQTVYGNVTNIASSGAGATINVTIGQGDRPAVARALTDAGIAADDAAEFAEILASERPESPEEPFGPTARRWIVSNIGKAAGGAWKAGMAVATQVLTEAAMKYYGLK